MLTCIIDNKVTTTLDNSPVSRVFALPVYIWRKSWYSFVSLTCNLLAEYIFIVEKKETSSSKRPMQRAPELARISPNLSQVQCGSCIGLGSFPSSCISLLTFSSTLFKKWWNVLLHLPTRKETKEMRQGKNMAMLGPSSHKQQKRYGVKISRFRNNWKTKKSPLNSVDL